MHIACPSLIHALVSCGKSWKCPWLRRNLPIKSKIFGRSITVQGLTTFAPSSSRKSITLFCRSSYLHMQSWQRAIVHATSVPSVGALQTHHSVAEGLLRICFVNQLGTFMEDFKRRGGNAQPYIVFTLFTELLFNKGIVLARGDIINNSLSKP